MTRIKTILVTTDFSETSKKAFPLARELADKFQAKIILVHSLEDRLPPLVVGSSHAGFVDILQRLKESASERLAGLGRDLGNHVDLELADGTPHLEIVRLAKERSADMIVMATHGRGFFSHAFLGSTTERVLRRASCPVLVVRDAGVTET
jgi:nucleotide-binding universal stress UspA family protein